MQCPLCRQSMAEVTYEEALIHTCDQCGGEFIGAPALAHIVATRQQKFPQGVVLNSAGLRPAFGLPEQVAERTLGCPECGTEMTVGNYGGDSGVFVDRCDSCGGIWLDRDELEHLQILSERWADEAPDQIRGIAAQLEGARREAAAASNGAFSGSRFAFVNALMNRLLDAA